MEYLQYLEIALTAAVLVPWAVWFIGVTIGVFREVEDLCAPLESKEDS